MELIDWEARSTERPMRTVQNICAAAIFLSALASISSSRTEDLSGFRRSCEGSGGLSCPR